MKKWLSRGHRDEVSCLIAAPADALYAMVSDLSRMGEWSPENCGGTWLRGSGPTVGGRFKGRNERGSRRWTTNVEVTAAEPGRLFEFLVHLVWPLTHLATWGYRFEPQNGSTLVTQYRQDHRPTWWIWVGSKRFLRISDPDAHYLSGMEATLEALAHAVRS
jgi:Polyketide cyclase / dehydrase and lipid transport